MTAEAELAKLEQQTLKGVSAWLRTVLSFRTVASDDPKLKAAVLAMGAPSIERQARLAAQRAYDLGVADAALITGTKKVTGKPSKGAVAKLVGLDAAGRAAVAKAKKLANADLDAPSFLAPLFGHSAALRASVSDAINRGGNEGSTAVADAAGLPTVWVAETDACLECLAYSGRVADPGEDFPGGLTYGAKSYNTEPLPYPPEHPNCRCTVEPLNDQSYADTLRREADRSVLRGFSLENESMKARVDAASRLLKDGVTAPASVKAYARASISAGKFATRGRP